MKYKIGDKVRITGNCNNHHYSINEEITIIEENTTPYTNKYIAYKTKNSVGEEWYVKETDMEDICPTEEQQLLLAVYREIWKDTVFQKCSHGLITNITEYLQSKGLIDKPTEQ